MSWNDYLAALQAVGRVDDLTRRSEQRAAQALADRRSAITQRGDAIEREFPHVTARLLELQGQLEATGAQVPQPPPAFDAPTSLAKSAQRIAQLTDRIETAQGDLASYRRTRARLAQRQAPPPVPRTEPTPPLVQPPTKGGRRAPVIVGIAAALVLIIVILVVLVAHHT